MLMLVDPAGAVQQLSDPDLQPPAPDRRQRQLRGRQGFDRPVHLSVVASTIDDNDFPGVSVRLAGTTSSGHRKHHYYQVKYAYATGWPVGTGNPPLTGRRMASSCGDSFTIPWLAGREVILVFFNFNYNRVYVIFTPSTGWAGGGSLATPLATSAASPRRTFSDVEASNVIYTRKGIVLADFDGNAVLKDFNGNDTGKSLDLGQSGEARVAFDVEGDTFYVFSPEKQMLYQGNTGW